MTSTNIIEAYRGFEKLRTVKKDPQLHLDQMHDGLVKANATYDALALYGCFVDVEEFERELKARTELAYSRCIRHAYVELCSPEVDDPGQLVRHMQKLFRACKFGYEILAPGGAPQEIDMERVVFEKAKFQCDRLGLITPDFIINYLEECARKDKLIIAMLVNAGNADGKRGGKSLETGGLPYSFQVGGGYMPNRRARDQQAVLRVVRRPDAEKVSGEADGNASENAFLLAMQKRHEAFMARDKFSGFAAPRFARVAEETTETNPPDRTNEGAAPATAPKSVSELKS